MDVKLYVHGTSGGHMTWGNVQGYDEQYINYLYGGSIKDVEADVQMWVEVQKNRDLGKKVCYYTYYRKDTLDGKARSGGYFALTLRLDCYYSYVSNIYSLLDAVFNSFIVGQILDKKGGSFQYKITDFKSHQAKRGYELGTIEEEIKKYLLTFSSNSNIIDLEKFNENSSQKNETKRVNLLDCEPEEKITNYMRQYARISISPLHPTDEANALKKKINDLKKKIDEINKSYNQRNSENTEGNKSEVKSLQTTNGQEYDSEEPVTNDENNNHQEDKNSEQNPSETPNGRKISYFRIFVIVILLAIFGISIYNSCNSNNDFSENMVQKDENVDNKDADSVQQKKKKEELKNKYSGASIDIAEITKLQINKEYTLSVTGVSDDVYLQGHFACRDADISNDRIKFNREGNYTIYYVISGDTVLSKPISVVNNY